MRHGHGAGAGVRGARQHVARAAVLALALTLAGGTAYAIPELVNTPGGAHSFIGGGDLNVTSAGFDTIGGGSSNKVTDTNGFIGGGTSNQAGDGTAVLNNADG